MLDYIVLIAIVIVLGLVLAYIYIKDKETSQVIMSLREKVEELSYDDEPQNLSDEKYKELDNKIYEIGESLIKIVRNLKNIDATQKQHEQKLNQIEEKLKLFNLTSSSNTNENKIISLFKEGKTIEEIANEERIPVGEVEFVIKLANLNVN